MTKPEADQAIASSHSRGIFTVIEGVNHMGFLERHSIYNAAIATFATTAHPEALVFSPSAGA